jgi:NAD(P)-dependent dehydrogenase (short-subunit alcohol dehydrogenase family)
MAMEIKGKAAVVTGGASGIGEAIVRDLSARGCHVAIADFDMDRAQAIAEELGSSVSAHHFDAADMASIAAMAEEVWSRTGGVDLVFANAGVSKGAPLLQATAEEFDWQFSVNVRGVWATGKAFIEKMLSAERFGHLTITASEHSIGLQHTGAGFYTGTKHAILGMADVWREELPDSIGISTFCPGLVATQLFDAGRFGVGGEMPEPVKAIGAAIMARGMQPADVARAAIDGTERGDFLIMTHPAALAAAEKRFREIEQAFQAQAPMTEDAKQYEVPAVIAAVMAEIEEANR